MGWGFAVPVRLGWVPVPALQPRDSEGDCEPRAGKRTGQAEFPRDQLFCAEPLIGGQRQGHIKLVRGPCCQRKGTFEFGVKFGGC